MVMVVWGMTAKWSEMIAMSVRKLKALIMQMKILQNNEVDDRDPLIKVCGIWHVWCSNYMELTAIVVPLCYKVLKNQT